jgi:hypothetical protein
MTNDSITEILVLTDRSGSMDSIAADMEGGLRQFIIDQQEVGGECYLSLAQFDHEYEMVHLGVPIAQVPDYHLVPRGSTALLDAIGRATTELGERLAGMPEDDRPGHVVVLIITDGYENSSRDWNLDRVKARIQEQTDSYSWTFMYLGANQDAIQAGAGIGVQGSHSLTYNASAAGAKGVFAAASAATTRSRGGHFEGYTEAERSEATK